MAVGGLLALLDDIAALLDDIAVMSKVAATKTAGIVGDDLAVNAQAMVGIDPKRELPIVWRVAKGSLRNKIIIVPAALFLSAFAEWAITPLLMLGGAFLCYEGAEKVIHAIRPDAGDAAHRKDLTRAAQGGSASLLDLEKGKIAEAVNTDFILSAEIVAVALAAAKEETLLVQAGVLSAIGLAMTVIVYGLVGVIIKLDDIGMYFTRRKSAAAQKFGRGILIMMPWLMKTLTVVGTVAMFSVGGGIILHGIPAATAALHDTGTLVKILAATVAGAAIGMLIAPVAHRLAYPVKKLLRKFRKSGQQG